MRFGLPRHGPICRTHFIPPSSHRESTANEQYALQKNLSAIILAAANDLESLLSIFVQVRQPSLAQAILHCHFESSVCCHL